MTTTKYPCIGSRYCSDYIPYGASCPGCGATWAEYLERKKNIEDIVTPYEKKLNITSIEALDQESKENLLDTFIELNNYDEEIMDIDNGIKIITHQNGSLGVCDTRGVFFVFTDISGLAGEEGGYLNKLKEQFFKEFPKKNIYGLVCTKENEQFFKSRILEEFLEEFDDIYSEMSEFLEEDEENDLYGNVGRIIEDHLWDLVLKDNNDAVGLLWTDFDAIETGSFFGTLRGSGVETKHFSHNNISLSQAKEWFEQHGIEVTVCLPYNEKK